MFDVPTTWSAFLRGDIGNWIGAFLTLAIFSILWKENPIYRWCEHIFVGSTSAYSVVTTFSSTIKTGVQTNMIQNGDWWEIIPICLGLLIYFQPFPGYRWISRFPTAYWVGYNAGMGLTIRTFMPLLTYARTSMLPLIVTTNGAFDLMASFNNTVFVGSLFLTLLYFFFSFDFIARQQWILSGGRWIVMLAFGASFGTTVMSRISLFLGRAEFLLGDWLGILPK
ncbi:MAG: hypothetical protein FWF06_06465 [Symbiobacteriaceae bacterium]|nr:hypothetical protein [Symbiobacteriaceae bacterium]